MLFLYHDFCPKKVINMRKEGLVAVWLCGAYSYYTQNTQFYLLGECAKALFKVY